MSFVKHKRGEFAGTRDPIPGLWVRPGTGGAFLLSLEAFNMLGRPPRVNLYYDEHRDAMAIEATDEEDADGYRISSLKRQAGAHGFFREIGLNPKNRGTYPRLDAHWEGDLLVIPLAALREEPQS